jgi:hypothetical protein
MAQISIKISPLDMKGVLIMFLRMFHFRLIQIGN